MNNSYRIQAERRASLSRPPSSVARAAIKPPLELPPWGYGSGRTVLSTPLPTIHATRHLNKPRTRSVSPIKQTTSCCGTGPAQPAVACSRPCVENADLPNSITYGLEAAQMGAVVELKVAESVAEKYAPNEFTGDSSAVAATAAATQHPYTVQGVDDSAGDMVMTLPAVTSSSMETWTTYDGTSTSPRVQSTVSSPHSLVTPELDSTSNTPLSPPQSATSWLRHLSPTILTTKVAPPDTMLVVNSADRKTDTTNALITAASLSSDFTVNQRSITSTTQTTANKNASMVTQELAEIPVSSANRSQVKKTVALLPNDSSLSGEVTVNTPVSMNSNNDGKRSPLHCLTSKMEPTKSPSTTSKANDDDKSSLMVGLVKVQSRHTGLMIDCPILETLYQNEVEPSAKAVRQSSSHKVVLIKAVVPRWAWNGRGQLTPNSSSRASVSSAKTANRSSVDIKVNKRKSSVSVNTQTSDTLLPIRRTISEHQTMPPSPTAVVDTHKHVPALEDTQLMPSPKLSACLARCKSIPRTSTECSLRSPLVESRVPSLPNSTNCRLSARAQNNSRLPAEIPNLSTSPLMHDNVPKTPGTPKETESTERRTASMDYDSLMEDTIETLKLDLHFSSSGNNSDSDSLTHKQTAAKAASAERLNRSSSSSSDDLRCDRQPSSSCQGMPMLNWSCAATAATASSDAITNFRMASYVNDMAVRVEPMPSSPHQKPTIGGRSVQTPPSLGRSPVSNFDKRRSHVDDASRRLSSNRNQSSPNSSRRNGVKTRLMPDSCSQPNRSPCPWRSATSNEDELGSWPGCDLSCHNPHRYEHQQQQQQSPSPQQHLSTIQFASRSESSLSDRSKSTSHEFYDAPTTKASPTMSSTSSRSRHTEQSSTLPPGHLVHSGGSDTCATERLIDVNVHYQRATNNYRPNTAGNVEPTTRQSKHSHRRSTPVKKHCAMEQKFTPQERHKVSTYAAKRSGDRQRKWNVEATRHGDVAQTFQSTGSMTQSRNTRSTTATTSKRQHSSSASRHMSRNARTDRRNDRTADQRASSSRGHHCSMGDSQRRSHVHSDPRPDRQTTSPGRRQQRQDSRAINASLSRSADSMSRHHAPSPSVHANHSTYVAKQSNSSQPKRADSRQSHRRDDRQTPATSYDCRQPVVYCSPRSLKPFPPPVSDRYPSSSFDNSVAAVVGTSLDADIVKYVFVKQQNDSDFGDAQPPVSNDYPHLDVAPSRRQERLYRSAQSGTNELGLNGRSNAATVGGGGSNGRRRKKTPIVDGQNWCAERPPWRQY